MSRQKALVYGGGGMIGAHLVRSLLEDDMDVYAVDIKPKDEWLQWHPEAVNVAGVDLSRDAQAVASTPANCDEVYLLAANMGGIGFIESQPLQCILSVDITSACLKAASNAQAKRLFYSSSACAYPVGSQDKTNSTDLVESQAWSGRPEVGYGEEKLFSESLCEFFDKCTSMETRVARYHNVYGTFTTYDGGREKAPAAIIRKTIEAKLSGNHSIDIWGDGQQTRSFMYMDDCIEGTKRIMRSDYNKPLNLGSSELVTINQLVDVAEYIAGIELERTYDLSAPQGVRGRNSDNTLIGKELGWAPSVSLVEGMRLTYDWIYKEMTS